MPEAKPDPGQMAEIRESILRNSSVVRMKAEATANAEDAQAPTQDSGGSDAPVAFPPQRAGGGLLRAAPETSPAGASAQAPSDQTPTPMWRGTLDGSPIELPHAEVERMVAEARNANAALQRAGLLQEEAREGIAVAEWLRKKAPVDVRERVAHAMSGDAAQEDDSEEDVDEPEEPVAAPRRVASESREVAALRAKVERLEALDADRQKAAKAKDANEWLDRQMSNHEVFKQDDVARELARTAILGHMIAHPQADPAVVIGQYATKYGALLVDRGTQKTVAQTPAVPSPGGTRSSGPLTFGNTARTLAERIMALGKKR